MARQQINVNPAIKYFEAYNNFSGGMNSDVSNELLADIELEYLENVDLSSRGSLKKSPGFVKDLTTGLAGGGQGIFFYYRASQDDPDIVLAAGGKLYLKRYNENTATEFAIYDKDGTTLLSTYTFQKQKQIDAVQYKDTLYIATGTNLLQYSGQTDASGKPKAQIVNPYKPTPMEALYIGTNALADNPDAYIQDKEGTVLKIIGLKPSLRIGAVNEVTNFTVFIEKPSNMTVEYKFEYKYSNDVSFTLGKDFSTTNNWDFIPNDIGAYTIKVTVRDKNNVNTTDTYQFPNYIVEATKNPTNNPLDRSGINTCRLIKLHWNRIILAQDENNPEHVYISDLDNPAYFPMSNILRFESGRNEMITAMLRYRDMLVVFTKTTIQALFGKSPEDYVRRLIHDGIGCIAPRSARIVGNSIMFLSEEGIHELKSVQQVQEYLNVERVDRKVASQIPKEEDACAVAFDGQYRICFPSRAEVFRYYYDDKTWTKDKSPKLVFNHMKTYGGDLFYQNKNDGSFYKWDKNVFTHDGQPYTMKIHTKRYDLSAPYNYKKLKKLYVLARHFTHDVNLKVTVYADAAKVLSPETKSIQVAPDGSSTTLVKTISPNMNFLAGTIVGSWILGVHPLGAVDLSVQEASIRGKCRRVQVIFEHEDANDVEIFGFGIEFKVKKP